MPLTGEVAQSFLRQAASAADLGSPFMADLCARLVRVVDPATPVGAAIQGWRPGDAEPAKLCLRLCAGLHALVRAGAVPGLAAHYPPHPPGPGFDAALAQVLGTAEATLLPFVQNPPQTNEVARSGVLIGGLLTVAAETGLPVELWEIGASAGINLLADHWAYEFGEGRRWGPANAPVTVACAWRGVLPPLGARLHVAGRMGADIAPLDPADARDRDRLLAYVWADQPERLRRMQAALAHVARIAAQIGPLPSPLVARAEAADWVAVQLARPPAPGTARVLMHSILWQYLSLGSAERISRDLAAAGRRATRASPLAWLRMERDGDPNGAALALSLWPGGEKRVLARADFHGRWADWAPATPSPREG